MKHIPTSATAIRKIKADAKRLQKSLKLNYMNALDRASLEAGYEHFHHAQACAKASPDIKPLRSLCFSTSIEIMRIPDYEDEIDSEDDSIDDDEIEARQRTYEQLTGRFTHEQGEYALDAVMEELDDLVEEVRGGLDDMTLIHPAGLREIVEACSRLTHQEPAYLDGYSHWMGALDALGEYQEAVKIGSSAYGAATLLIPKDFGGHIPYYWLENRPFHRLAYNLALAHLETRNLAAVKRISDQMQAWWPSDNMGFRLLFD